MTFTLFWTEEADAQFKELMRKAKSSLTNRKKSRKTKPSKEEGLFKQVHKSVGYLQSDPKHPSLNTHEYSDLKNPYNPREKVFEAYAQNNTPGAYRIFWCYGPKKGEITLLAITPHP